MEFHDLILKRRSVRAYQPGVVIPAEDLAAIVEAARQAPSWKNRAASRLYIASSAEAVAKVRACLPGFNRNSTANASAYIITTFVRGLSGHTEGKPDNELADGWGAYDLGLNNAYLLLKATELGYDSLIMGLRDASALREAFAIPANEEICAVLALGKHEGDIVIKPRVEADVMAKIL